MAVVAQVDIFILHAKFCFAVLAHGEIRVIAGVMAFRIVEAVFLVIRIEMRPRRLEVRRFALGILMEVQGVLTGRQILQIELHPYATGFFLPQGKRPHALTLSILELNNGLSHARCARTAMHNETARANKKVFFIRGL